MIYESELKVLELLWTEGNAIAKDLAARLKDTTDWSKTTSYTVIKKCVDKGLVGRTGDNFMCTPLITREEAQKHESEILAEKMFGGSSDLLIASLLGGSKMTTKQVEKLRNMVQGFSEN